MNTSRKVHIVPKINGEESDAVQFITKQFKLNEFTLVDMWDVDNRTVVVAIGGDGTVIHAAKIFSGFDCLIAGINLGHLGFLPDFEQSVEDLESLMGFIEEYPVGYEDDYDPDTLKDIADKYQVDIEHRHMLTYRPNGKFGSSALNEFYITDKSNQVLKGEVHVDGALAFPFVGDGLIVGTPTGSTAYSLSAGGAIIDPKLRLIQITPVASHMLTSRPVIVGDTEVVLKIDDSCDPILIADGQEVNIRDIEGVNYHEVSIEYENEIGDRARVIRNRKRHVNIFDVLKDKLYFSSRND
jgi:NAD+ kinase